MNAPSRWGVTPRESIERECGRRGHEAFVSGCLALLAGREVDPELILALGGPGSARWADPQEESGPDYWLRVWAARGLLWAWDERATPAVIVALDDPVWRVREMAAKIAARHYLGDALPQLQALQDDSASRVRAAADRAVTRIVAAGT